MVGTRMMQKLLAESRKARAKVVLVGDERQLQPIEAGGPFASLIRTIGAARLTENKRQHEPWMRQEVKHFLQGSAQDGLRLLAQHDRLHLADTRPKAMAALIKDWQIGKPIGTSFDKSVLILGAQREDVRELNKLAQAARLKATELKKNSAATAGHYTFHPGDRVVFTRNDRKLQVLNGDFGTVVSIRRLLPLTKPQVRIRLDEPGHRRLWGSGTRFVTVVADSSLALDLGYAITTHKAQGATVDRSYVLLGGSMTDRELTYVQMSRARDETHVYASEADAGEDLAELVAAMSRSRQKDLAHDVARIAEQERSRLSLH
jgi:ATP-dependent exoDNAse (exonuclease V) alpha subunit